MNADRRYRQSADAAEKTLDDLVKAGLGAWELTTPGSEGGRPGKVLRLKKLDPWKQNPQNSAENDSSASVDKVDAQKTRSEADGEQGDGQWTF